MTELAKLGLYVDSSGVVKATGKLKKLQTQSGKNVTSNKKLEKSFGALKTIAVAFSGSLAVRKFVETAGAFESMKVSLETVTGSAEKAQMAFDGIKEFATETPFSVAELTQSFIKLKALGIEPTKNSLTSFGNTASAMGKSLDQMIEAVADAATGEFERLKEFGIKARKQGDEVTFMFQGVSTTVKNSSKEITGYLESIGNTQFAGAMSKQMDTINGKISNLGDGIDNLFVSFSEAGGGTSTKGVLDSMIDAVAWLTRGVQELPIIFVTTFAAFDQMALDISFGAKGLMEDMKGIFDSDSETKTRRDALLAQYDAEIKLIDDVVFATIAAERKKQNATGNIDEAGKESETAGAINPAKEKENAEMALAHIAGYQEQAKVLADAARASDLEAETQALASVQEAKDMAHGMSIAQKISDDAEFIAQERQTQAAKSAAAMTTLGILSTLTASKNKKIFKLGKVASLASAGINTALAITKTMSDTPYPWNIPLAAAQGLAGMVQIQNIKSQKFSGQAHDGMDFVKNTGSYQLERGEMVVDKGTSQKVREGLGGGAANITFAPVIQAFDPEEAMANKNRLFISFRNQFVDWMNEEGYRFA